MVLPEVGANPAMAAADAGPKMLFDVPIAFHFVTGDVAASLIVVAVRLCCFNNEVVSWLVEKGQTRNKRKRPNLATVLKTMAGTNQLLSHQN